MINRLKVDTLTPELLVGPTFELMKGTCKSLVELEYFFEEVYKATTEQLDWTNPEGQRYPHDLQKPLPLIPNSRGRQVIPFAYFINNDLAYLSGGDFKPNLFYFCHKDQGGRLWKHKNGLKIWSQVQYGVKYRLAMTSMLFGGSNTGDANDNNFMDLRLTRNHQKMSIQDEESLLPDLRRREAKLRESHTQIAKLQRKQMGNNNKIALARFRIANLEQIIEDIQIRCLLESISNKMPSKRTSTSKAPAMTQAAIKKLVADSVFVALEAQAANMANTDNTTRPIEAPIARKCSYKDFMGCQPINFKDYKVKFATGSLTEEALSWWSSFAQPIRIEEAYKITWVEFKKLLIKKYYPRTEVQKMEDEFYHLTVKGNDLKAYVRRFQELATLCPTMVPNYKKMIEVFIGGLPRNIKGNVTASNLKF
ncbi:reverse transcriptase domain-containing protein [Tanacetum coccineum]